MVHLESITRCEEAAVPVARAGSGPPGTERRSAAPSTAGGRRESQGDSGYTLLPSVTNDIQLKTRRQWALDVNI